VQSSDAHDNDTGRSNRAGSSLLQEFSDALIVCDGLGTIGYMNVQAERLLGLDGGLVVGRPLVSLVLLEMPAGVLLDQDLLSDLCRRPGSSSWW
jgi:PAS domain-containing protein